MFAWSNKGRAAYKAQWGFIRSIADRQATILAGEDPLLFIPFNQGADNRYGGKVSVWVHSWWKTKKGMPFGGSPLRDINKDNMFELRDIKAAKLWMMPPAAMAVVLELLCEDRLAHPQ